MKISNCGPLLSDSTTKRSCFCNIVPAVALLCLIFFIGSAFITTDYKQRTSRWRTAIPMQDTWSNKCKDQCRPYGSEALPKGIVTDTSNLEMQPLWGFPNKKRNVKESKCLLALAVGIKQKENVHQIVQKFTSREFTIMLFHYDGVVDEWGDLPWSAGALHISAINQTKWWFAKRFLHPDIVAEYKYIFIWDEDLGVENFNPGRYLSIVEEEGLEISQPALDPAKSQVHHRITVRGRRGRVHRVSLPLTTLHLRWHEKLRPIKQASTLAAFLTENLRIYKHSGGTRCDANSTQPPCTGWVEMMAPVFSRSAWRCAWYMIQLLALLQALKRFGGRPHLVIDIQNDLIHAWGLDMKLGYCTQGDRTKNVGVVDSEYIVHYGLPTLGASDESKSNAEAPSHGSRLKISTGLAAPVFDDASGRIAVRRQSYVELEIFNQRWRAAVEHHDECWKDPYPQSMRSH